MAYINEPVFYDKGHHRWKYSKWIIGSVVFLLIAFFSFTVFSVVNFHGTSTLNLANPQPPFRGAPNVPKSAGAIVPPLISAASAQKSPLLLQNSVSSQTYKPKVIGFFVNWDDASFSSLKNNVNNMDEVIPEWLHLNGTDGSVVIDDQIQQDKALSFIRKNRPGLPIVPLINNFNQQTQDWDGSTLSGMLSDPAARAKNIQNLLDFVKLNNFSGISIDFEAVPDSSQSLLVLFMQELYAKFNPLNLEVSQNIPLDDPAFDAKKLGQYSDFIILMAYDDHSIFDTQAGPVADQNWYQQKILERFSQLPPEKYLISLGNYGYDWKDGTIDGQEVTFQDALRTAREAKNQISIDPVSLNPTLDYYNSANELRHVWYLDATTTFNEISAVKKYMPSGYVLWRLGSEDPSVWKVFGTINNLDQAAADNLKILDYGYAVDYEGNGEILKVTSIPKQGSREINYNKGTGLITQQSIIAYPASYIITRWGGGTSNKNKIALTFDDGPDETHTPQILDILKKYNTKATFFVIGVNANQLPDLLKREVQEGHEIGNHTYTHPNISTISNNQFSLELNSVQNLFAGILGRNTRLFRPPYAEDIEPETPEQINPLLFSSNAGYYTVAMHIDPSDWSSPGVEQIVNDVISGAKSGQGNIVLLHDSGGDRTETVAALPKIIEGLQANGFELVTVSDLLGVSYDSVMPPVSPGEKLNARLNGVTFNIIDWIGNILVFLFKTGIVLGILRLLFIGTLAIIQWTKCRFGSRCKYFPGNLGKVSVIVPAYNEEKVILATMKALLNSDYPDFEIIVIDDGSQDRTYEILQSAFSEDNRVKFFTKQNGGKATALNFGISYSEAEIIVTLDADTLFAPDAISKLARHFSNPAVGAVAGNAKVGNRINILTRWQALEYITSQNLDRRAFELMNAITVVPGAVGAWKKEAILEVGGFSNLTLAEDTDLTFAIIKKGYKVRYEEDSLAFTEAPDTVNNFIKQRFRWMYGSFQAVWKHRDTWFRPRYGALGLWSIPNVLVFQVFFPLISPVMDLVLVMSLVWATWQNYLHPLDYSAAHPFQQVLAYYLFFLAIDLAAAVLAFLLERRREDWTLIFWLLLQRFFYRQLMYYVAIKTLFTALKGKVVGWKKFERKATVEVPVNI
ncbi:MAG TPA: polysaccharide deacetylase family protein [Patescibacteria group bacterium]